MTSRDEIARKLAGLETEGPTSWPAAFWEHKPGYHATPRIIPTWGHLSQTAPATTQYALDPRFRPSENIEDRRLEPGGPRRDLGVRIGFDQSPNTVQPWEDPNPGPNPLSRAAGMDDLDAREQLMAEAYLKKTMEQMAKNDPSDLPTLTEEEKIFLEKNPTDEEIQRGHW